MKLPSLIFGLGTFGLLIGLLAGLSSSPIVATIVSALMPLLAGLVYWKSKGADNASAQFRPAAVGIGCFSLAAIVGVLSGIWTRTHGLLSPAPSARVAIWREAGLQQSEAISVAMREYDGSLALNDKPNIVPTNASTLFSSKGSGTLLEHLPTIEHGDLKEVLKVFQDAGGNLATVGTMIESMRCDDAEKLAFAQAIFRLETDPKQ